MLLKSMKNLPEILGAGAIAIAAVIYCIAPKSDSQKEAAIREFERNLSTDITSMENSGFTKDEISKLTIEGKFLNDSTALLSYSDGKGDTLKIDSLKTYNEVDGGKTYRFYTKDIFHPYIEISVSKGGNAVTKFPKYP